MSTERLRRAREVLQAHDVDALLVGPGADLRYLIGYHALPLERLTMLIVPARGDATLIVPQLEAARATAAGASARAELVAYGETDDPMQLVVEHVVAGDDARLAVADRVWAMFLLRLQARLPGATWVAGSELMQQLRVRKDADEIAALRDAAHAIDAVHAQIPKLLVAGRTEREIGRDIEELVREGHDDVNFVIVASGPNGASPHHETGDRSLQRGDAIVVDIGGTRAGYCSDSTRNYALGPVDPAYAEIHRVLELAQQAAIDAVAPGVAAEAVDAAARTVIADAGFGDAFVHRTGHGIGVDEHEAPWIVEGDATPLAVGMAFSVEPGIYLPGRFGARIEDIVAVSDDGCQVLNAAPRDLVVVDA
ncbi:MAG: Xaa-Pro peptidase family protein [Nitriliruptoraceae bacterium]